MDQGRKAQFSMLVKARNLDLPIDIQCKLFEAVVFPTLLYGCEVWGLQIIDMLELFFRKFLKKILGLRPSTPNCIVYGEVGKLPLQIKVDKQLITYWFRLLTKDDQTFAYIVYMIVLKLILRDEYQACWFCRVKCILDNCDLSYMWYNQHLIDAKRCKIITCKRIEDIALQKWYTDISISPMCTLYRLFKKHLNFEKYIIYTCYRDRISLSKLRCTNSKLPIYKHIYTCMYDSDTCTLCNLDIRGDEYHYVLICPFFKESRKFYIKPYFYTRPNLLKFEKLYSSSNKRTITRLAKFAHLILNQF